MTLTHSSPPTDTAHLLSLVADVWDEFAIFPSEQARDAVTLWTLHTHVFRAFDSTPRLSLCSEQPASGKTRVLEILECLVPEPINGVDITPGVLWRSLEHSSPTILMDEADTIFGKIGSSSSHRYLRGILNAGHRRGATVPRCVGAEDVKLYHVFGPVALAGLGRLPETITTRSVTIHMRQARADESVAPFRLRFVAPWLRKVRGLVEVWAESAMAELSGSVPELPVRDRAADVWEPLVAIADLAGPQWGARARDACLELTDGARPEVPEVGEQVLSTLRTALDDAPSLSTADALSALSGTFDARSLATLLAEYGLSPVTVRDGDRTHKGYRAADLAVAFWRYLPELESADE